MNTDIPTILIVEDEPDLADLYSEWLAADYDVQTAYGGEAAIETLDESIDVALIDRMMPDISGDTVLEYIRTAGLECRVAMVTAVEPDFDIIEMGFDEYIVKPVREDELKRVIAGLISRSTYDRQLQAFFALVTKRATLEAKKSPQELHESEAFQNLSDSIDALRADLDQTVEQLTVRDLEVELCHVSVNGRA